MALLSRRVDARTLIVFVVAAAVYAGLAISASRAQSSTFDEPIHLPPGYLSLTLGDHRMNPDHPPLVRRLAALPLLFLDVKWERNDFAFKVGRPWEFGKRFLYRWNDAEKLLFWGRLPIVALTLVLLAAIFLFTRARYGESAAGLALFLGALNPDLLAHGAIVSTDLGIALFTFLAVLAFLRVVERITPLRVILAGLAVGAACATKFSGLGLLPMLGLPALVVALDPDPLLVVFRDRPSEVSTRRAKLAVLGGVFLAMGVVGVATVWAAYGFHAPLAIDAEANAQIFDWRTVELGRPWVQALFTGLRRFSVLPQAWIWGVQHFLVHVEGRPAFLLGQYSEAGFWYYFPATFAFKTPVALLVLLAAGLATARRTASSRRTEVLLLLPLAVLVVLSLSQRINIGHRHLLPIYPFVLVIAGRGAALAFPLLKGRVAPAVAVSALCLWQALSTAWAYPHYLAYFNELAGGPSNGWRLLGDSNLDWGQGLKGLRTWMSRNHVPRLKLAYFGTADVGYYGIDAERLPGYQPAPPSAMTREIRPGDVVAVSATLLQGLYVDEAMLPLMKRLRATAPVAVIGYSIFVYRADFSWDLEGRAEDAQP
jgi:4-amino-4-deoxy-L-arabinose transferase-like glycosyltransferase